MAMIAPKCFRCSTADKEVRHYSTQCPAERRTNVTRSTTVTESAPTNVTPVSEVTKSGPVTNVTGRGFGTGSGRQRVHKTNAGRQAAYRERRAK